ncbi:hypothetical protein KGM_205445B, partial [Danaus plexippus plexippus]
TNDHKGSQ